MASRRPAAPRPPWRHPTETGATPRNGCSAVFEQGQGEVSVQARGRATAVVEEEQADPSAWWHPTEMRHSDGRGSS
jgi:hypothetical protein